MKFLSRYLYLITWLLINQVLSSCEEVVHLYRNEEPVTVLNCLLCPDSLRVTIELTYTLPIGSGLAFAPEKQATVELEEEGKTVATACFDSISGNYFADYQVKHALHYKIIASLPSGRKIWGETQIPVAPADMQITIDTSTHLFHFTNQWRNVSGGVQYCWLYAYGHTRFFTDQRLIMLYVQSPSPLPDPFNIDIDSDYDIPTRYEGYMRIENSFPADSLLSVYYEASKDADTLCASMIATDRNYDLYLKAYVTNKLRREDIDALPIFYEPAFTHSNISGGVGLVGAYCGKTESRRYTYKNPYTEEEKEE